MRLFVQDYPISRGDHLVGSQLLPLNEATPTSAVHARVSRDSNPDRMERLPPLSSLRRSLFLATFKVKKKIPESFAPQARDK